MAIAGDGMMRALTQYHGGNSVLKNQLFLVIGFKHHGIFIEGPNAARELYAAEEVNRMLALSLRAVFRNESWIFCAGLVSMCPSPAERGLLRASSSPGWPDSRFVRATAR